MRFRFLALAATTVLALGACDADRSLAPDTAAPELLLGGSPLQPLQAPLEIVLWSWTDPKTRQVSYAVTTGILVREDLFQEPIDPDLRLIDAVAFRNAAGKTVVQLEEKTAAISGLDPQASGTDGYALVVIAQVLSDRESQTLTAALAAGTVQLGVETELVTTAKDGSDDVLDQMGGLLLADPRPSPMPFPPEWF